MDGQQELVPQPFDLLHVTPPMSSPDFLKTSPLANDCVSQQAPITTTATSHNV